MNEGAPVPVQVQRIPLQHASTHNAGGSDALAIDAAAGTGSLRTLGTTSTSACAGNDSRLSDSRTPTSHSASHNAGGSDALAIDAVAGTGSLRTLGTSDTSACAGNDSRLSDARTPTAHQSTHAANGSDALPWTGIHGRGTTANKPAAAAGNAGYLYYDTDLQRLERSNGTSWDVLTTSSSTNTIRNGTGAPSNALGNDGDFYIATDTDYIYGPKAGGVWPAGESIIGPQGPTGATGAAGADGKTILNGTGAPSNGLGVNGDFYIATDTNFIYGPKAGGVWPAGVSLVGPTGATGATGAAGSNGTNGTDGNTTLSGIGAPSNANGNDGDFYIDTQNWVIYGPKAAGAWPVGVKYAYVDMGTDGSAGVNWDKNASAADNGWNGICWSPERSLFVAVSDTGTGNRVMTSPDGVGWTTRTSAVDNTWQSVCWSPSLLLFVAVANSGTGNRVMTSPDGTTWTARTSAADNNWLSVCWSPSLSLFVAVANSGTGNRVMTSPDGTTWTARTSAADNGWYAVCWSPERSLFVAVSDTGTGNRVMTSPDGTTWTTRTSAADNNWRGVCWSPERSLFVAVSDTGTGNRVMTSPDGTTWTTRSSAADNSWRSVCWSSERRLFIAVAYTGSSNRIMTSPDGFSWTIRTSPVDNQWISICWAASISTFAAVANTGTGNRVMTSRGRQAASSPSGLVATLAANTFTGVQTVSNTTESTSKDTGSIVTEGGIGAEKSIFAGGPSCTVAGQVRMHYDSGTSERGMQVKISNRTGETSVKGKLVHPSSSNDNAVELVSASAPYTTCGVIYEAGIANGSDMWVWMPGSIVEFLMENSDATTRQDWMRASATTNGRVQSAAVPTPPNSDSHFTECGHALESNAGGTDQLVLGFFHVL